MARTTIEKNVEDLQAGDIATFRQGGKVALFKKHLHEKVTDVDLLDAHEPYVSVRTVNKEGIEDQYLIPNGTVMRVHVKVQQDYDVPAEDDGYTQDN